MFRSCVWISGWLCLWVVYVCGRYVSVRLCALVMCMWACVCCMCTCMCAFVCVCTRVCLWICGACVQMYMCIYVCVRACLCGYIHVCGFAFTWTVCVHAYMSLYTPCARVCTCGCVCVSVYACMWMCVYKCAGTHMHKYKEHVSWGCALNICPRPHHRR